MNWRYACPEGHISVRRRGTGVASDPYYYCETCRRNGVSYKYTYKVDKKTGEKITV